MAYFKLLLFIGMFFGIAYALHKITNEHPLSCAIAGFFLTGIIWITGFLVYIAYFQNVSY